MPRSLVHRGRGLVPRSQRVRYAVLVVALCMPFILLSVGGAAAANPTTFASGTLVIPMDTDTGGNHASYNQNSGMWKAYGLVYKLLQSGVPVHWAIADLKSSTAQVDVSVSSAKDKRTSTSLGAWDYKG